MASSPPPRPRGRPARPDAELRAAALEAATWLLLNEGYAAATLEAVARRAGMAKKTVYRFAANREDLVAQVVRGWTDTFVPVMAQEVGGACRRWRGCCRRSPTARCRPRRWACSGC